MSSRFNRYWNSLTSPTQQVVNNWWAHALLSGCVALLSIHFLTLDVEHIYASTYFKWAHLIFLPFHEAGHLFFGFLGQFIGSLGGTLGQLLLPIVCLIAFLKQRNDTFAAAVCAWWFALNFLDIAPYLADAREGVLPLLGGNFGHSSPYGFHDWHYLLNEMGLLAYDNLLASACLLIGKCLIIWCNYWIISLLWKAK
ncbi:hypothetical protein [Alteromonas facilis]|uniref:hypothetical protein n=1 Tax=Alteromonas facilis TaxID=2048004 RepID=UPI000C291694|nr:hypothetical protein [Alteromonas facilis]